MFSMTERSPMMLQFIRFRTRSVFILLMCALFLSLFLTGTAFAERPYKTCDPSEVHPIWWKAHINYDVPAKNLETGEKVPLSKGTDVILMSNNRSGRRRILLKDGTICSVPHGAVAVYEDACTPGDYSVETKEAFVNSRSLPSKTKYLIWVSTDMQSLTVFTGSNKKWEFLKAYKCSSGMVGWASPLGKRRIVSKTQVMYAEKWNSYLQYFLSFGGSGIHKWPGSGAKTKLGVTPCSHACVRLSRSAAIWMYKHIPVDTCLLIW